MGTIPRIGSPPLAGITTRERAARPGFSVEEGEGWPRCVRDVLGRESSSRAHTDHGIVRDLASIASG